jgi:hypothetical protein
MFLLGSCYGIYILNDLKSTKRPKLKSLTDRHASYVSPHLSEESYRSLYETTT